MNLWENTVRMPSAFAISSNLLGGFKKFEECAAKFVIVMGNLRSICML